MKFNQAQRTILYMAGFAIIMLGIFPPWCVKGADYFRFMGFMPAVAAVGQADLQIYSTLLGFMLAEISLAASFIVSALATREVEAAASMESLHCPACGKVHMEAVAVCNCGYEFTRISRRQTVREVIADMTKAPETPLPVVQNMEELFFTEEVEGEDAKRDLVDTIPLKAQKLIDAGSIEQAEKFYLRSIDALQRIRGEVDPSIVKLKLHLAKYYLSINKYNQAEDLYIHTLEICDKNYGQEHVETAHVQNAYASLLWSTGRKAAARPLRRNAMKTLAKIEIEETRRKDMIENLKVPEWLMVKPEDLVPEENEEEKNLN